MATNYLNVYEAAINRYEFIFNEFPNVYLSFSGGKDSGVMLNLAIDVARSKGRKLKVMYIDLEAMYTETVNFVQRLIESNLDVVEPEWICLPLTTTNSVSMFEPYWTTWCTSKKDIWVREMPTMPYVVNLDNAPDWYQYGMSFEDFIIKYAKAEAGKLKTACLVGIRTQESLNRWRAINREDISRYKDQNYTVKVADNVYNAYPIYDWAVEDIWTYNGKFNKDYNKIYDLMFRAGLPLSAMRICEPYGDEQKAGLNLFKVIEPKAWTKIVGRVNGANFGNIYCNTKATGAKAITLPDGHNWRSYCRFLLRTLPADTRREYTKKFIKFIQYWRKTGSPLTEQLISNIESNSYVTVTNEFSVRGKGDKRVVRFKAIPDTITGDSSTDMLSWRRMCLAILKNDITCKTLSFSITKQQQEAKKRLIEYYQSAL